MSHQTGEIGGMAETLYGIFVIVVLITAMISIIRTVFLAIGWLFCGGVAASKKMCDKGDKHET